MKKLLSVVLVLAMILGSFSMVFASDFSDVKDSDSNSEAINVLSGLGVIGGYADGTFRPEGVVTRAEMATMIVNALGIPVKGSAATQFSDVPASHWASGYINYAASVGFIAGYTDGTFQPEKQVSYNEAIAMIVASLGYKASMLPGTYPGSFINKATSLGILDNCKTTGTIGANRGDIAQMIYDAADCAIGYIDNEGRFQPNEGKSAGADDTMFDRLGCVEMPAKVITGAEDATINLKPYMGAYATYYVNDDDIVAIADVKSEFIEGKLADLQDDYTFVAGCQQAAAIYASFDNGKVEATDTAYTAATADTIVLAVELSGKKVKKVYSMQQWNITEADQIDDTEDVQAAIADDHKLLNCTFAEDDNEEIDMDSFVLCGVDSLEDIAEDMVVYVYANGDGIAKIEVGTEVVTGKVAKVSSDSKKITVAGKEYKFADGTETFAGKAGDEYELTLDYAGKIWSLEKVKGEADKYGIITAYAAANTLVNDEKIQLWTMDETKTTFLVDEDAELATTAAGVIVKYSVDKDGEIDAIVTIAAMTKATDKDITKASYDGKYFANDAVIITAEGIGDEAAIDTTSAKAILTDKDNLGVTTVAKVEGLEEVTAFYTVNDNGKINFMVMDQASKAADDVYAMYNGYATVDSDAGMEAYFVIDGKEVTYEAKKNFTGYGATVTDAVMYTLTFDGTGAVKAIEAVITDGDVTVTDVTKTTAAGVKNNAIVDSSDNSYSVDKAVTYFKYDDDDDKWVVSSASKVKDATALVIIDVDGDKLYDFVLIK